MEISSALVLVAALLSVSIIGFAAIQSGYDGHLITTIIALITSVCSGVLAYVAGKKSKTEYQKVKPT